MNVNLEFVPGDNPTVAFENAVQTAANILDATFTDNVTINLTVGYGEVDGQSLTNGEAAAGPNLTGGATLESYSTVRADLIGNASPGDSTFDFLPTGSTIGGQSQVMVFSSQQKLFGQIAANGTNIDGGAGFAKDISTSNLVAVALHELTHAMGRSPDNQTGFSSTPDIFDFTDFTGGGAYMVSDSVPAPSSSYFSLNEGFTKWADYGVYSDPSDWLNFYSQTNSKGTDVASYYTPEDAFNQYYDNSTLHYLSPADLEQMEALGYHLKVNSPAIDNYDFNGYNSGDILVQSAGGKIKYGDMAGGVYQGLITVGNTPGWSVVGEGKISGGVDSDIVIESGSGQVDYADMVNGTLSHYVAVANVPGWNVVGVGDINDDHHADIVIQNTGNGQIGYANMSGGVFNNWVNVATTPGWSVRGVGDINGDGFADVVIQSQSTGQIGYANMANGVFTNFVAVGTLAGYNVVGVGEVSRTGWDNIVVQNPNTSDIQFANMNNGVNNGWIDIGAPGGWNVVAVEDVLGNGFADIVIQDGAGDIDYANMTGGFFQGWVAITTLPSGFSAFGDPATSQANQSASTGGGAVSFDPPSSAASVATGGLSFDPPAAAGGQSASWLTNGAQSGAMSTGAVTQYSEPATNSAANVAGDSLQGALRLGA